jgi:hypothetical protein
MNFNCEHFGVKVRCLCFGTQFSSEFESTHFTEHSEETSGRTHSRVSCEDLHIKQWNVVALPSWWLEKSHPSAISGMAALPEAPQPPRVKGFI